MGIKLALASMIILKKLIKLSVNISNKMYQLLLGRVQGMYPVRRRRKSKKIMILSLDLLAAINLKQNCRLQPQIRHETDA